MKFSLQVAYACLLVATVGPIAGCGGGDGGDGKPPAVVPTKPADSGGSPTPVAPANPPTPPADDTRCDAQDRTTPATATADVDRRATGLIVTLLPTTGMGPGARAMATLDPARRFDAVIARVMSRTTGKSVSKQVYAATRASPAPRVARMLFASTALIAVDDVVSADRLAPLASAFAADPDVAGVELDDAMTVRAIPTDPEFARQWNFMSGAAGIDLPGAWDITTGAPSVVTAVLDTGYVPHADLVGNLLPGYDFLTSTITGNNGHGRGPDATDPGDWVTKDESNDPTGPFRKCDPHTSSWHGTRVAGLIGASANNGIGIVGANWYGKILPVRVLGKCGGPTSDLIDGLRWAAGIAVPNVPANPYPAKVINLSLGGNGPCGDALQHAIDDVVAAGSTIVVAAGNDGVRSARDRPANCRGVIAVGSTDNTGRRAWDSNFGPNITLSAPGANVWSTTNTGTSVPRSDAYNAGSGASYAAPQVAGVVSLMLTVNPALSPARIADILKQTARSGAAGASLSCRARPAGAGIVDAAAAVAAAQRQGAAVPQGNLPGASVGGAASAPGAVPAQGATVSHPIDGQTDTGTHYLDSVGNVIATKPGA
ncbi:S8 family peptidase [Burkholderia paludis]|uniref:S8 family peptidase n=1 Tax=Burkholderia paludis TaxID=1506587 RepID=UPI0009DDB345